MPAPEALPDSRDGLTRMERIVLSTMHALWFRADGPMKKTALLVEELRLNDPAFTGAAVEATLAQLNHPWSRRNPLIEVSGPLCRLTQLAEELFVDLDKNIVDFEPGFSFKLPCVLPAPFPLVLAKGSDGFPPHALFDVIGATSYLLQFPQTNVYDMAGAIRGPDFDTGGVIDGSLVWLFAGSAQRLTIHACLEIQKEQNSHRARIIATELPRPLERGAVAKQLEALSLEGVASIRDESTATEDRLVVELVHVAYVWKVRTALRDCGALRYSQEVQLRINEDGEAVAASLLTVIDLFLGHRRSIVTRRLRQDLRRVQQRAHAVEGLLVSLEVLEPVMNVIRDADDPAESFWGLTHLASPEINTRVSFSKHTALEPERLRAAATALVARLREEEPRLPAELSHRYSLGFSEEQARAILATRKPAALRKESLFREWVDLAHEMARLDEPLHDVRALEAIILGELAELRTKYSSPRRTAFRSIWR